MEGTGLIFFFLSSALMAVVGMANFSTHEPLFHSPSAAIMVSVRPCRFLCFCRFYFSFYQVPYSIILLLQRRRKPTILTFFFRSLILNRRYFIDTKTDDPRGSCNFGNRTRMKNKNKVFVYNKLNK